MDRVCPYLALAAQRRDAVDAFDPEHRCHALDPAEAVDQARQSALCLSAQHRTCDRFLAAEAAWSAHEPLLPRPAPDAVFASTRLLIRPEPTWLARRTSSTGKLAPARLAAAGVAAVGGAALLVGAAGVLIGATDARDLRAQATPIPSEPAAPVANAPLLGPQQPSATPLPTARPDRTPDATPRPRETPGATARPTPEPERRTYVVAKGDTLTLIAARYGTTVGAIQQANGLRNDVINIGQALVIP